MVPRGKTLALAIALLLLPILSIAPAHATPRNVLNKPNWTVGDFWNYTVSISVPDPTGGPPHNETGIATMTVSATEKLMVGSNGYDTFKLTTKTRVLIDGFLPVSFEQSAWYLRSDLSLVQSIVNFTFFGTRATSEEAYSPPQLMQWPVESGISWSSSSTVTINSPTFQSHFVQPESATFVADAPQRVTVAAGAFRTVPLEKTAVINGTGFITGVGFSFYANEMGLLVWRDLTSSNSVTSSQSFWSNDVGAPVRQVITGDLGFKGTSDLTSFLYQAHGNCGDQKGQDQLQLGNAQSTILPDVASFLEIISCRDLNV